MAINRTEARPKPAATPTTIGRSHLSFVAASAFILLLYFLQYAVPSAPGFVVPELAAAFGLTTLGVSSLLGLCYYSCSTFALVVGASLDRRGAKSTIGSPVLS